MRNITEHFLIDLDHSVADEDVPVVRNRLNMKDGRIGSYLALSHSLVTLDTRIGRLYSLPPLIDIPSVPSSPRGSSTVLRPASTLYVSSSSQMWNSSLWRVM